VTEGDERLDRWIRSRIIELVESSPEPPPFPLAAPNVTRRRLVPGLVRVAAAACAVAIGVGLALTLGGGPGKNIAGAVVIHVRPEVGGSVAARLPRSVISDGHIDWAKVPHLVAIVNPAGGVLGYMMKNDLDGTDRFIGPYDGGTYEPACGSEGIDVYNLTRTKVVGSYYPNAGFVPVGTKPVCRRARAMLLP
jgi:hypothetical protein